MHGGLGASLLDGSPLPAVAMQFFNFPSKMFLKIFKIFFVAVSSAVKFFGLISRIAEGENTQTEVARSSLGSSGLVLRELGEPSVGDDLAPASSWHFGDGGKPGRDVGELQTSGRRQAARQLSADLECYVAHGGKHRNAAMPQPRLAAPGEVLRVPISRGAARSTEAGWNSCQRSNSAGRLAKPTPSSSGE